MNIHLKHRLMLTLIFRCFSFVLFLTLECRSVKSWGDLLWNWRWGLSCRLWASGFGWTPGETCRAAPRSGRVKVGGPPPDGANAFSILWCGSCSWHTQRCTSVCLSRPLHTSVYSYNVKQRGKKEKERERFAEKERGRERGAKGHIGPKRVGSQFGIIHEARVTNGASVSLTWPPTTVP